MARTTADITLFNSIFSSCNTTAVNVSLSGMRIGYPVNWWSDLSTEVSFSLSYNKNTHITSPSISADFLSQPFDLSTLYREVVHPSIAFAHE